jgi:GNAT superfamily N-acetyltransferase
MEWVHSRFAPRSRDEIFSIGFLAEVSSFVENRHQFLAGPDIKYVCSPDTLRPTAASPKVEICLYHRDRMAEVYRLSGFRNALSYDLNHDRPDMLATVAFKNGAVVGIAGASADSDTLWQIGVGVADGYHRRGIGKTLVSALTKAVIEAGKIPYYSTWPANIASNALAQSLGFWHAWTEIYARDKKRL